MGNFFVLGIIFGAGMVIGDIIMDTASRVFVNIFRTTLKEAIAKKEESPKKMESKKSIGFSLEDSDFLIM